MQSNAPPTTWFVRPMHAGSYEVWHQWQRVGYGPGAASLVSEDLDRLGVKRPFLITNRSLVSSVLLGDVMTAIGRPCAGVFAEVIPHCPMETVLQASAEAMAAGADGVVTFGSGSCSDTGKGIALAIGCGFTTLEDFTPYQLNRDGRLQAELPWRNAPLPQVAIPTTLSGAELSGYVGLTDTTSRVKHSYSGKGLAPNTVLLDPKLTIATPRRLWASTGIKTLSDATEYLASTAGNPIVDVLCLNGLGRFTTYLESSLSGDLDSRLQCQLAAWMVIFGNLNTGVRGGLGASLRHQLGSQFGAPHGEIASVLLPALLTHNLPATPHLQKPLAASMSLPFPVDAVDAEVGRMVISFVASLIVKLGLPTQLRDIGVTRDGLREVARKAFSTRSMAGSPRPEVSEADVCELLESVY